MSAIVLANELLEVDVGLRRDLARDVHLARDDERFARDAPHRVVLEDRVEHGIRDLIRDFIRMTFGNGFRRKETAIRHLGSLAPGRHVLHLLRRSACRS